MKGKEQLMRMRKDELRDLAVDNARKLGHTGTALSDMVWGLDKRGLVNLLIRYATRLSAREGRQGE